MRIKTLTLISVVSIAAVVGVTSVTATTPHFYSDDPLLREPEPQDAGGAAPSFFDLMYELTYNLFALPRHKPSGVRAQNINTIDEVPDSSWFTNRIGTTALTIDDVVRGPNAGPPPDPSRWVIWKDKSSGSHPGFSAKDANGQIWFLEFDPEYYPEAATAAAVMGSKFFWALPGKLAKTPQFSAGIATPLRFTSPGRGQCLDGGGRSRSRSAHLEGT